MNTGADLFGIITKERLEKCKCFGFKYAIDKDGVSYMVSVSSDEFKLPVDKFYALADTYSIKNGCEYSVAILKTIGEKEFIVSEILKGNSISL